MLKKQKNDTVSFVCLKIRAQFLDGGEGESGENRAAFRRG